MLRTSRATQATQKPVNLEHVVSQKSRLRNYDALLRFVLRRQDCPEENLEEIAMAGGSGQMLWLATTRSPHGVTGRIGGLAKELYAKGGWHFRQSESGLPENVSRVSARRAQHRGKRTCRVSSRALSANFPEGDSLRPAHISEVRGSQEKARTFPDQAVQENVGGEVSLRMTLDERRGGCEAR